MTSLKQTCRSVKLIWSRRHAVAKMLSCLQISTFDEFRVLITDRNGGQNDGNKSQVIINWNYYYHWDPCEVFSDCRVNCASVCSPVHMLLAQRRLTDFLRPLVSRLTSSCFVFGLGAQKVPSMKYSAASDCKSSSARSTKQTQRRV